MKLYKKIGVTAIFALLASSPAYADVMLTGKHNLVSIQPEGTGSLLTFSLSLSNTGTSAMSYAKLVAKDPLIVSDAATATKRIDVLSAGDTVMLDWTVSSSLSPDQLTPGMDIPFNIEAEAADDAGNFASFLIASKGGAL